MAKQIYFASKTRYWVKQDSHRAKSGGYTPWAFDFISIHLLTDEGYSLMAPLCLLKGSTRPRFEQRKFTTLANAKRVAVRIAKMVGVFVVNCTDQESVPTGWDKV